MTTDYKFLPQYQIQGSATTVGATGVSGTFYNNSYDLSRRKVYGSISTFNGICSYNFSTELFTQEPVPTGTTFGVGGCPCAYDSVNDVLFVSNGTSPGVLYKINASNFSTSPIGIYNAPANFITSVAYSPTSNVVAICNGGVLRFINASTMTLITSVSSTVFSHIVWTPENNEFVSVPNIRFVSGSSYSITGSLTTPGFSASSGNSIYYSGGKVVACNSNSPFNLYLINVSTRSIEKNYTSLVPSQALMALYFDQIKTAVIGDSGNAVFVNTTTDETSIISSGLLTSFRSAVAEGSSYKLRAFTGNSFKRINLDSFVSLLTAKTSFTVPALAGGSLPSDDIYFPIDNKAVINVSANYYKIDSWLSSASSESTTYQFSWTRITNTSAVCGSILELAGDAEITGDFTITMGASTTLTLGTRSEYTERFTIPSTGTILVRNDVTLTGFTLSAGATINRASGVTDPITVTVLSDPGIVAGPGVIIAAPEVEITLTGLVVGSEVRVYESGTITELAGIETSDTTFTFTPGTGISAIDISVLSDNYQNLRISNFATPLTDTTIPISQVSDRNYENS